MKVIIGLGNPGREYTNTRHNIGFMAIDHLAQELGAAIPVWEKSEKNQVLTVKAGDVLMVKPQTFMNNSGEAVRKLMQFYKLNPADIWIVHDDMDLPLGKIRIREKGGTAGHNGVESIRLALGTDVFLRFRLGIGRDSESQAGPDKEKKHKSVIAFVLSRFSQGEAGSLKHLVHHATTAIRMALDEGIDRAMNRYN
jgi:PTH1 family peptidyl-tRNA hydrolase